MLKDYALHYYEQGYNCAESLVYGANAAWHLNLDENACHLMAGLGGGLQVGDVCGNGGKLCGYFGSGAAGCRLVAETAGRRGRNGSLTLKIRTITKGDRSGRHF